MGCGDMHDEPTWMLCKIHRDLTILGTALILWDMFTFSSSIKHTFSIAAFAWEEIDCTTTKESK